MYLGKKALDFSVQTIYIQNYFECDFLDYERNVKRPN